MQQGNYRYFSRGFVHEIHCTHDYFLGHAAAIFSSHPVERVVLISMRPERREFEIGVGYVWGCQTGFDGPPESRISEQIHDRLVFGGPDSFRLRHSRIVGYRTEQLALDALSCACVALGRGRAGLPALAK